MALKINDHGQIVGNGYLADGKTYRGYVMTPLIPVTPQAIILSPTNHQSFFAGTDIPLNLWLVPNANNLARVDCFQGGSLIGSVTNAPYNITWHGAQPGQYNLTARTTTPSGATVSSKAVLISVLPLPALDFAITPDAFTLFWPTSPAVFGLQYATNLTPPIVWQPVPEPMDVFNGTNFTTVHLTNDSRFFRLILP
jgi:hypothetical protein